jgi:hypothetical protein
MAKVLNPILVLSTVIAQASFDDVELKLETIRLLDHLDKELSEFEFSDDVDEVASQLRKLAYSLELEKMELPEKEDSADADEDEVDFTFDEDDDDQ